MVGALLDDGTPSPDILVVTADRALRQRLPPDVVAVGPNWLNRLIDR